MKRSAAIVRPPLAALFIAFVLALIAAPSAAQTQPEQSATQPQTQPEQPATAPVPVTTPAEPASSQSATAPASAPATQPVTFPNFVKEQPAEVTPALPESWIKTMQWRSIGPANMGGRITAIAVSHQDPSIWYVATASGGIVKTVNNGFTFEHQFDHEATVSIGDLAVAPSDHNIVWVGTGEANPRNSSSWGDGVYKSTDGGKTWKNMSGESGLRNTFQIGQIAIHPTDPNIVYVGALGRLWGASEDRGLYKTTDGGEKWEKVLAIDDKTGVIDVKLQPGNPDVILAATYERQRDGYDGNDPAKKFGLGAGIHKSIDGGKTWEKITAGLPSANLGRIGLEWYAKDPNIVYAIVESEKIAQEPENAAFAGFAGEDAEVGCRVTRIEENSPAARADLKVGDIIVRCNDVAILSNESMTREIRKRLAGDTVKLEVSRERKIIAMDVTFDKRPEAEEDQPTTRPEGEGEQEQSEEQREQAGRQRERAREQARTPFSSGLGGQRENVHDQQGPDGREYGGLYMSTDAGETWKRINSVNPRPMYYSEIRVDPSDNKYIYVLGTSLYKSEDGGATFTGNAHGEAHVDHHALWIDPRDGRHMILGNDGGIYVTWDRCANWDHHNHVAIGQFYHVGIDTRRNFMVYGGLQDNGSWAGPTRVRSGNGPINEDWISIGGGDGFICFTDPNDPDTVYYASQNGGLARRNLKTGEGGGIRPRGERGIRLRWNWETPYILSSHNSRMYYTAANYVFRSLDRGNSLERISEEITTTEQGTASAIAESPRDANALYVGTDDGNLWVTRDGGREWTNVITLDEDAAATQPATQGERGEGDRGGREAASGERGGRGRGQFDPARIAEQLKSMDANGDGLIQRDEVPRRMVTMFGRFDRNSDGAIDKDELDTIAASAPPGAPAPAQTAPVQTQPAPAETQPAPPETQPAATQRAEAQPATPPAETEDIAVQPQAATQPAAGDDPLSGEWQGSVLGDDVPAERATFTFSIKLEADGKITGTMTTPFNEGDLTGRFNRESKRLEMSMQTEQFTVEYTATLGGSGLNGHAVVGDGMFEFDFEAKRVSTTEQGQIAPKPGATRVGPAPAATTQTESPAGRRGPRQGRDGQPQQAEAPVGKPLTHLLPGPRWVSSIEASRAAAGRVYVTFDGHRSNDDEPYVLVSEDYGRTWRSIRANLPTSAGSTKCVREDIANPNMLYLGCEFSAWISIDRGASWTRMNSNLPTVAVHDFAQHPTSGEIVAATHGRSLWVADVAPLRQLTLEAMTQRAVLCKPSEALYWRSMPRRAGTLRRFVGQNPSNSAQIYYALTQPARQRVRLQVIDPVSGDVLREVDGAREAGLYRVEWDLRRPPAPPPPAPPGAPAAGQGQGRRGGGGGGSGFGGGGSRRGALVPAGMYRVALTVDDVTMTQTLNVQTDPEYPDYRPWETEEMELELEHMFEENEGGDEEIERVN